VAPRTVEECELAVVDAEETARGAAERASAAEAESRQARAVLAARDANSGNVVLVRAPVGGRVLRVPERSERIVAAGALLMELGDPASLEVVIDVLSSDAAMVHPGDRVRFVELGGGDDAERAPAAMGRVRDVEPSGFTKMSALGVEEQRVNVIAEIEAIPASIGDGFRVEASIRVWSAPKVLVVPRSALLRPGFGEQDERGWSVFVVRAGRVEARTVRVGHVGGAAAEVLDGVNAGEEVVVFPSDRVAAGTRVAARKGD
jgi:HlyD family secretion protein